MAYNADGTHDKPMGPATGWFIFAFIGAMVAIGIVGSSVTQTPADITKREADRTWEAANECMKAEQLRLADKGYSYENGRLGAVMQCGQEIDRASIAAQAVKDREREQEVKDRDRERDGKQRGR